jgi:DNA-binding NtrC family response regulator
MTTFPVLPDHVNHVLVASPSTDVRQRVLDSMLPRVRRVEQAHGGAEALIHLENGLWQMLLLDRRLPDLDAEELSETVRRRYPAVEVVLLDHESEAATGLLGCEAVPQSGTADPAREGDGQDSAQNRNYEQAVSRDFVKPALACAALPGMIGDSPSMQPVYRLANLVAARDTTVLITGPTGCGKELVARALHQLSPRAPRPFSVINCAAIPETLLEAELFGYTRGAFTGALQSYAGRIQTAHLGTLFLDEIGDMPLSLQPKLLRFLEQKELQRLGSAQVVKVDARVVAATNVDLLTLVRQGKFREDLYYRLAAFPIAIPPLTERPADVRELAAHFLERFSQPAPAPVLSEETLALLQAQSWPGNVRELQNVMERASILAGGEAVIRPAHLMFADMGVRARPAGDRTSPSGAAIKAF